jgi:hypothetical protein
MSFFDAPGAVTFRHAADGRLLFRPFGRVSGTWEVSPERAEHLLAWQRRFYAVSFVGTVLLVQRWGLRALWTVPLVTAVLLLKYWHFARTLPRATEEPVPVTRGELFEAQAKAVGSRWLGLVTLGSVLMLALGAIMCMVKPGRDAYMVVSFFGLCAVVNGAQWWAARRRP